MNSQEALVTHLIRSGVLRTPALIDAFLQTDRIGFIPEKLHAQAYSDAPLPIGYGQTISQPYTVAFMLELLQLRPTDTVLDIGAGSGWSTALLARCVKHVTALERIPELLECAQKHLEASGLSNYTLKQALDALGIPGMHFDRILVSAAARKLPEALCEQLAPGGIMVIPIQHDICVVTLDAQRVRTVVVYPGFSFVPLIG
jgi:protein-L-isoaspartate(D-aspartate) O-methyltransferase